jgi:molybdenum ABC transporter molybdate-binding protein
MKTSIATILLAGILSGCTDKGDDAKVPELVMLCAAGIKHPVTRIAKQYEEEYGVRVQLQFGGSGTLLANLEVAGGDIYLAADSSYTNEARKKGLVAETIPVAWMKAGYGVAKGNPKQLSSLADLKNEELRIGIGNPEAASVGRFTKKVLNKHGAWEGFEPAVTFPTVNELANAIKLGTIDAAILWDAVAYQYPEVDFVSLPEFDAEKKDVTVAVATTTKNPTAALRFCRFLAARDRGLKVFEEEGFAPMTGDVWVEEPELLLYSGAMLRPAIEETVRAFQEREGVTIRPVYNGCGILVSQMRAGEKPDAYFSCDMKFLDMVQDRFETGTVVTANEMVILTEKGNPKQIDSIEKLAEGEIRLGLSHPEKSALGFLTKDLLVSEGLYEKIRESGNLKMESPTGDFLVNQLKASSLDAVIVYRSNAMASSSTGEDFDIVDIDRPKAVATQPYAIGRESDHPRLMQRFLDACISATGKEDFLQYGFRWELQEGAESP